MAKSPCFVFVQNTVNQSWTCATILIYKGTLSSSHFLKYGSSSFSPHNLSKSLLKLTSVLLRFFCVDFLFTYNFQQVQHLNLKVRLISYGLNRIYLSESISTGLYRCLFCFCCVVLVAVAKMDLGEDGNNNENLAAEIYGITTLIAYFMKLEFGVT